MHMNRQISEGKIYNLLRDCRESLIELVEQLQLIKRLGEDYILDKFQNETKLLWDQKLFVHLALMLKKPKISGGGDFRLSLFCRDIAIFGELNIVC